MGGICRVRDERFNSLAACRVLQVVEIEGYRDAKEMPLNYRNYYYIALKFYLFNTT